MCRGWAPILLHQKQRANEDVITTNTNILQHQDVCFQSLHCLLYIWLTVMKILCSITSDVVLKSFYQTLIKAPYWLRLLITLAPPKMPLFVFCITPELPSCYSTVHLLSSVCLSSCFSLLSLTRTHTYIFFFFYLASSTHCEFFVCLFLCPLSSDWLWVNREPFGGGPLWIPNDDTGLVHTHTAKQLFFTLIL